MRDRLAAYKRLFSYLRPYPKQLILAYCGMLVAVVFQLFIPQLIRNAIDDSMAQADLIILLQLAGLILLVAAVRGLASFAQLYYSEWLTHQVSYDLRNDFYQAVQTLPFSFHDKAHTGDLMSRATSDINETERFIGIGSVDLLSTVILLVGVVVYIFFMNQELALLTLLPMLTLMLVAIRFGNTVRGLFKALQEQMGVVSKTMQESLTGIQLVKAFAREPHELSKFDHENNAWFEQRVQLITVWANNWPLMNYLVAVGILLLLWFGGPLALEESITIGTLYAMINYMLILNGPVQRVGFLVNLAATAVAASSRVFEIMDTPNEIALQTGTRPLPEVAGHVAFEKVSFGYHNSRPILQEISFESHPGQTIALIGPTGSGKSTLTNLIPRFYDVTGGRILIDGQDIREVPLRDLRRHIAMVLQDSFLFSDTIAENIAYGRTDATLEEIIEAARIAFADQFINNFPDGYQTMVGERGVTLSGGQKQRIAIARALLADPRILILDDSTSSVDTETEFYIQQALQELMKGRTTFVIAQRLLTLKNADQILVLDHGRIVEQGSHDELLQNRELYWKIYDMQLKDQEEMQESVKS